MDTKKMESAAESAKALDDFQYRICKDLSNKTMKDLLDKDIMTRYAKARFVAYARILSFQTTLEAFKADPQGQEDNLDKSIKDVHNLVDSLTNDLDNKLQSIRGNDAISATLNSVEVDQSELDEALSDKFREFEVAIEKISRLEKTFVEERTRENLLQSNLKLITPLTSFPRGSRDCWKRGYFFDEDVREAYDARRSITDAIIKSIDKNNATILFGDAHSGKSVILRRVMFEEIEKGYVVIFGDDLKASTDQLINLLAKISKNYSRLLVIADNVHRTGSEGIFGALKGISTIEQDTNHVRFLLAARENKLDRTKPEVDRAFEDILPEAQFRVGFEVTDAVLFVKQAISVTLKRASTEADDKFALGLYEYSEGDPFMFNLGIKYQLSEGKKTFEDFIALDIEEKIKLIVDKDKEHSKAALLSYILGMVGISVSLQNSTELLVCCGVIPNSLDSLAQGDILLKIVESDHEQYRVRHEKYALEFLVHFYSKKFWNNIDLFDQAYGVRNILRCIWNNIGVDRIIDILTACSSLYGKGGRYKPLYELIATEYLRSYNEFIISAKLSNSEKAKLFSLGLGNLYFKRKDYNTSIEYYDKSVEADPAYVIAWNLKGLAYYGLEDYNKAIESYDNATEIKIDYANAWYNKGVAWYKLDKFNDSIASFDDAIKTNSKYYDAWYNKGLAYYKLENYTKAIESYDKAIEIQNSDAAVWYNRACSKVKNNEIDAGLSDLDQSIKIGGLKYINEAKEDKDLTSITNDERFKRMILR